MPGRDRERRRVAAMLAATLSELREAIETLRNLPGAEPEIEAEAATEEPEAGAEQEGQ